MTFPVAHEPGMEIMNPGMTEPLVLIIDHNGNDVVKLKRKDITLL